MTVVVAAIVEVEGRFLLTRRLEGTHLEGLWEFPGGKIHFGESDHRALVRELREELDVDAEVGELVLETTHAYPDRAITLRFYRCRLLGTPYPRLGQQMQWVERADLARFGLPPADEDLVRLLTGRSP